MKGWQRNLPLPFCLHIEASIGKPIAEKGYKMKKEYIKPEAEMMKFLEEEDLMTDPLSARLDITDIPDGETWY